MPLVNEFNELNLPYLARRSLMALKNAVINLNTLGDLLEILSYLRWYDIDIIEKLKKKKRNNFLNYLINKLKQIDKKDKEFKVKKNQIMSLNRIMHNCKKQVTKNNNLVHLLGGHIE